MEQQPIKKPHVHVTANYLHDEDERQISMNMLGRSASLSKINNWYHFWCSPGSGHILFWFFVPIWIEIVYDKLMKERNYMKLKKIIQKIILILKVAYKVELKIFYKKKREKVVELC